MIPELRPREPAAPALIDLMGMSYDEWDAWSRGRAVRRAGYSGLRRNIAVALGNWGDETAVAALESGIADPDPLVRSHSAWALGRVGSTSAIAALEKALSIETDREVIVEIDDAIHQRNVTVHSHGRD